MAGLPVTAGPHFVMAGPHFVMAGLVPAISRQFRHARDTGAVPFFRAFDITVCRRTLEEDSDQNRFEYSTTGSKDTNSSNPVSRIPIK